MDDFQQLLLDFYCSNSFVVDNQIKKELSKNQAQSGTQREQVESVRNAAQGLALIDCDLRKTYSEFCDSSISDPALAVAKFKEFISASVLWEKVTLVQWFDFDSYSI